MAWNFLLILVSLVGCQRTAALEHATVVEKASHVHSGRESVALIETGYGVRPQYGQGVVLSRLHVLTSAVLCSRKNRDLPETHPPRLSIYVGSLKSFSTRANLYTASSWDQLFVFGRRKPEHLSLCLISLDFPIEFSVNVYAASFGYRYDRDGNIPEKRTFRVFSFGSTEWKQDDVNAKLMTGEVFVDNSNICKQALGKDLSDSSSKMYGLACIRGHNPPINLNIADTGAPMFGSEDHLLYGIVLSHVTGIREAKRVALAYPINKLEKDKIFTTMRETFKQWKGRL